MRAQRSTVRARIDVIMQAATELLSEKPVNAITMSDIANRSGVPRTAIYNHFQSTISIFEELSRRQMATCWTMIDTTVARRASVRLMDICDDVVDGAVHALQENPAVARTLLSDDPHFAVFFWSDDFARIAATHFNSYAVVGWPVEPATPADPFYTAALMLLIMLSTALRSEDGLGEAAVEQIKGASRAYMASALARHGITTQ